MTADSRGELTEHEMLVRVRAGDAVAERMMYDRHVDRVYRLAFRMTGDDALAQDVTQDTFIRAFDRIETFRGASSLGTWLYAIANSVALNTLRKVKRLRGREAELDEGVQLGAPDRESEPDLRDRLRAAIDELPEKYRNVFVLHDVEGYKHQEIADMLGIELGTSKAQLSRARVKLRVALEAHAPEWV